MSTSIRVRDLLDLEASVEHEPDEGEDEGDEDELRRFIDDDEDIARSSPSPPLSPPHDLDLVDETTHLEDEAAEIRQRHARRWRPILLEDVPRVLLLPAVEDPALWAVRVKTGDERDVFDIILDRAGENSPISAVFIRPSIPGYVLVETDSLADLQRTLSNISSVLKPVTPVLVPIPNRTEYLQHAQPRPEIQTGRWVACQCGMYQGDIGVVQEVRASGTQAVVALLPRIRTPSLPGRRRAGRPEPRVWTYSQLVDVFGKRKVKRQDDHDDTPYRFSSETFVCGLIFKVLPSEFLDRVPPFPDLLPSFARLPGSLQDPAFGRALVEVTQSTYKRDDRVEVISGEYRGAIGTITVAVDGRASVAATLPGEHGERLIDVGVDVLRPRFQPGDHMASRLFDSSGIIASCQYDDHKVTYIEAGTQREVNASCFAVRFELPDQGFYKIVIGDRVVLHLDNPPKGYPRDSEGPVESVKGDKIHFTDEYTGLLMVASVWQVKRSKRSARRERPDDDHPLIGQEVALVKGNYKGYRAVVKDVTKEGPIVEIEAKSTQHASSRQLVKWDNTSTAPKAMRAMQSRATTSARFFRTPTPPPAPDDTRPVTPPDEHGWPAPQRPQRPSGSTSAPQRRCDEIQREGEAWMLQDDLREHLDTRVFACNVCDTQGLFEGGQYDSANAQTVPARSRKITPRAHEVVVEIARPKRPRKQVSIPPHLLDRWPLNPGCNALVIRGNLAGMIGEVKSVQDDMYKIEFQAVKPQPSYTEEFHPEDLAAVYR